ncbi:unnamed protein product [Effrenium voratum]|nr:unnamed protein product [Effrenium voratum]
MSPLDLFLPIRAGGMGTVSGCCNGHDANLEEQRDSKMKDPPPAEMVPEVAVPPAASRDQLAPREKETGPGTEYEVVLDKSGGKRLGIDVDHKDGKTLLIECINDGLVKARSCVTPRLPCRIFLLFGPSLAR